MYLNNDNNKDKKGGNKVDNLFDLIMKNNPFDVPFEFIADDNDTNKCDGCPIAGICKKKENYDEVSKRLDKLRDKLREISKIDSKNSEDETKEFVEKKEEIETMKNGDDELTPEELNGISEKLAELGFVLQRMAKYAVDQARDESKDEADDVKINNTDGLSKAVTRAVETNKNKQKKEIVDVPQRLIEKQMKNSIYGAGDLSTPVNEKLVNDTNKRLKDGFKRDAAEGIKRLREKTEEIRKKMKNDALGKAMLHQTTSALAKAVKEHDEYVKKKEAEGLNIHISFDEDFIEALNNIADAINGDY